MRRFVSALQEVLASMGNAFQWYPTGRIDQYVKRQSVEERMHRNFARVGARLEAAMGKVKDEQRRAKGRSLD